MVFISLNTDTKLFIWLGTFRIISRMLLYSSGIIIFKSAITTASKNTIETKIPTDLDNCSFFLKFGKTLIKKRHKPFINILYNRIQQIRDRQTIDDRFLQRR